VLGKYMISDRPMTEEDWGPELNAALSYTAGGRSGPLLTFKLKG
jgi:hypothetical protein